MARCCYNRVARLKTVVVAQLVEPQIVILVVAGSSPVDHPTFSFGSDEYSDSRKEVTNSPF